MIRVAARFRHHVDLRAGSAPVLRAELRALHLELGQGVDDRHVADGVVVRVGIDGAIQQESVVVGASSRGAVGAHLVEPDRILLYGAAASVGAGLRTRRQQIELRQLPSIQRQ